MKVTMNEGALVPQSFVASVQSWYVALSEGAGAASADPT